MVSEETDLGPVLGRVRTGIEAFDDLVMGGLPRGRMTIVGGAPGSGKTVFATQFLAHGIADLAEAEAFAPKPRSGRQERIENLINRFV